MKRVLIVEPHSDDSCIGIGGYLLKYQESCVFGFLLLSASDIDFAHCGMVTRATRLKEYSDYVSRFRNSQLIDADPFNAEGRLDTVPRLEMVSKIDGALKSFEPDVVIAQGPSFHHDHVATYEAVIAATRPTRQLTFSELLVMENPTYVHSPYGGSLGVPNLYIQLEEDLVDAKNSLFRDCFPSQLRDDTNCLSPAGVKAWARYRGIEARCEYAEALHASFRRR